MPLTAFQFRIIIVIILFCVAINLILYTSALFSTSRDHMDNIIGSLKSPATHHRNTHTHVKDCNPHYRLFVNKAVVGNDLTKKERKRNSILSNSARFIGTVPGRQNDDEGHVSKTDRDAGMPLSSFTTSSTSLDETQETRPKFNVPTSSKTDKDFDIETVLRLFDGCVTEGDQISVDCFNDAFGELSKIFRPLGTIFNFVTSEIQEKISILRDYRQNAITGQHFRTVQSMVRYEMDHNLTNQKDKPSGSRTFLRLHWALQFISALVTKIKASDNSSKFSEEATEAYDNTLARHHPWIMRKAVHLAMYALPERKDLLEKLNLKQTPNAMAKVQALTSQLDTIYDISQQLYAANNLLNLP